MGCRLVALGSQDDSLRLVGAIEAAASPQLGNDAGTVAGVGEIGLPITQEIPANTNILIDFSNPAGAEAAIRSASEMKIALVMATTGLSEQQQAAIRDASKLIPVVWSPSMSLAVNLTMKLTEIAARALKDHPSGADVEIIERHHRFKEDSPSGTALKFGQIVAAEMGQQNHQHGREGICGARPHGEIGYHAVRTGDNPGEHTIVFGLLGETLELRVAASNRDCYASGALAAAKWLAHKPAGLYNMYDVLGF
jgi:4-hydroxy-tetrahydrodipicolinate reductase